MIKPGDRVKLPNWMNQNGNRKFGLVLSWDNPEVQEKPNEIQFKENYVPVKTDAGNIFSFKDSSLEQDNA